MDGIVKNNDHRINGAKMTIKSKCLRQAVMPALDEIARTPTVDGVMAVMALVRHKRRRDTGVYGCKRICSCLDRALARATQRRMDAELRRITSEAQQWPQ